jgi:hypothetical protein
MALILNRNLDLTYEVVQGLAGISIRLAQLHEAAVPAAAHPALAGGQAASDGSSDTKSAGKDFLISSAADLDKELKAILERQGSEPGISVIHREMSRLAETVQTGDAAPTQAFTIAFKTWCDHLDAAFGRLNDFLGVKLPAFNKALGQSAVAPLVAPDLPHASACGPM